ncbi:hypothetical protein VP01_2653g7 [Puccinia sorghi]|uniref:Retrovirus-related Pol polyprotein from transposon TNT 1-94-like beta-barrel domain-containing protein n=1 Tax=Puccinia sorghi TaxID=27349 RepID=A0A0L6V458_9BASI|nr:hypothetical protein VP01_2653g7 [Puccinia sorghi]
MNLLESVTIKTESALAATTIYCSNGARHPATTHSESKCWQLHPELKKSLGRPGKKQAKAAVANDSDAGSSVPSDGCYLSVSKRQEYSAQGKFTMFLASGCSNHLFPKKEYFSSYKSISSQIEIANGNSLKVEGSGYVQLNNGHGSSIKMALHVPQIIQPLISSGQLFCKGCTIQKADLSDFNSSKFVVVDLHIILQGKVKNNIFALDGHPISS